MASLFRTSIKYETVRKKEINPIHLTDKKKKSHKPPELPASLFGWILPLIKIGDEEMLENVGLDALLVRTI